MYWDWGWQPYVSVAERRLQALQEIETRRKKGLTVSPVKIEGRTIANTFWGKAWCANLEHYSDYGNRLPRGRSYVRNGSVFDLQIDGGEIKALVSGSNVYQVEVKVTPVLPKRWKSICADCAGAVDSLVELLQGRFSKSVMERLCQQETGLFPSPDEIQFSCSCPDGADMCKHIAAVLYGVGARLDKLPELLFRLSGVDETELIARAGTALPLSKKKPDKAKVLTDTGLSELFGLDLAVTATAIELPGKKAVRPRRTPAKRAKVPVPKKTAPKKTRKAAQPSRSAGKQRGGGAVVKTRVPKPAAEKKKASIAIAKQPKKKTRSQKIRK